MFRVVGKAVPDHDPGLVLLACLVCVLAAVVTVRLLDLHRGGQPPLSRTGFWAAVAVFGSGVWITNFIGVLAFRPSFGITDAALSCGLSMIFSFAGVAAAFILCAHSGNQRLAKVLAALTLATTTAITQFLEMRLLPWSDAIHYDIGFVVASLGLVGLCSVAATRLLSTHRRGWASACLTLSVLLTHVSTVGATTPFIPDATTGASSAITNLYLIMAAAAGCIILIIFAVVVTTFDNKLRNQQTVSALRMRTLVDTAFDGVVFERHGRIVGVNRALCHLAGSDAVTLIGLRLADLIPEFAPTLSDTDQPTERVVLLPDGQTRPVELRWHIDPDRSGHVLALRDLSRQKAAESQIERLARFDTLTGLANRTHFEEQVQKALALANRTG